MSTFDTWATQQSNDCFIIEYRQKSDKDTFIACYQAKNVDDAKKMFFAINGSNNKIISIEKSI